MRKITSNGQQPEVKLLHPEARYRHLLEVLPIGIIHLDHNGQIISANPASLRILGRNLVELQTWKDLQQNAVRLDGSPFPPSEHPCMVASKTGKEVRDVIMGISNPKAKTRLWLNMSAIPNLSPDEIPGDCHEVSLYFEDITKRICNARAMAEDDNTGSIACIARDITRQKASGLERTLTIELLDLANSANSTRSLLTAAIALFREHSGCDAVGIRLREGDDYPYFEARGFSSLFLEKESNLKATDCSGQKRGNCDGGPQLQCICGQVLSNGKDFKEFLTAHGTFWNADLDSFSKSLNTTQRTLLRGQCLVAGFQSVALIPLGKKNDRIGLLQLNSRQKGQFTPELIAFWESIAEKLTIAIEKVQAEEALKIAHDELNCQVRERTLELHRSNAALSTSEDLFRQMAENVREVFWLSDEKLSTLLYASPAFEEIWGHPCQELVNPRKWLESIHPDERDQVARTFRGIAQTGTPAHCEYRIIRPDGSIRWISDQASPVKDENGVIYRLAGVARDVTTRIKTEQELQRANRALMVLKECDEALARTNSEPELLERICQIVLKIDGMKMAWVGLAEDDPKKTVRPVAYYGGEMKTYLAGANISWADELLGRGPVGTAIRTQDVCICRDVATDERLMPWRKQLLSLGITAVTALPLVWDNESLGALTIYSADPDTFNELEIDLLKQLAGDLTYGIITLRTLAERAQLQKELLKISEREKQIIAQELHDGLCQHFAGTLMITSLLHTRLSVRNDPEAENAKQICDLLYTGVNQVRNISHGLHPVGSRGDGLVEALAALAQTASKLFRVDCSFSSDNSVLIEDQTTATHLFRIAQEAVNNAIKHGESNRVMINLKDDQKNLVLSVWDNGIGFPAKLPASCGLGLQIMRYRASAIGANLSIGRAGKSGTQVVCVLPIA